ncbi:MAG TPA: MogA/MoaB family molybdenum cofactor biosynthesis protein [Candidatus Aminicenantes bacterium]|nr:MogA/MoaB family molybdenum cofactor biosynthesis protein [Candidatus Aminicenantes bacterium]
MTMRVGILTVSDKASRGEREDRSGPAARRVIEAAGGQVVRTAVVPDEEADIRGVLVAWSDEGLDLVLTTGGTGFGPRDRTPEATKAVIERETPGLPEAMRRAGAERTPAAILSRAAAGIRKSTLIVNLPGSERAVRESLAAVLPALAHGLDILRGAASECAGTGRRS